MPQWQGISASWPFAFFQAGEWLDASTTRILIMYIGLLEQDGEPPRPLPYGPSAGKESPNIGCIDLRTQPERIGEIQELNGFPELKELVQFLNDPLGTFFSILCDTGLNVRGESFDSPTMPFNKYSCLTITVPPSTGPDDDRAFLAQCYSTFAQWVHCVYPTDAIHFLFVLAPVIWTVTDTKGWTLDVRVTGFGESDEMAHANWIKGSSAVSRYLLEVDKENRTPQELETTKPPYAR